MVLTSEAHKLIAPGQLQITLELQSHTSALFDPTLPAKTTGFQRVTVPKPGKLTH
jgi:hypothetical protein